MQVATGIFASQIHVSGNLPDVSSVAVTQVHEAIRSKWPSANVKIVDLFHHSTIQSQAALVWKHQESLSPRVTAAQPVRQPRTTTVAATVPTQNSEIAIIGIAGRFPGASTPDELYQLFVDQKEGLSTFPKDAAGPLPFKDAIYVPKKGALSGVEDFDPAFWGLKEDEAR